ncbi:hypothetical protein ABID30_003133 [Enterococcus rotai]|uniref:Uncharacterized protein n=1 Tax=Enterococcus rotai TaxID=118060 RepID=A0A0U2X934_9ENTE|nr:hypothetical protein [Enterococcus rotai]ALS36600.1 hypothetical protein ATZ35_05315 [Enterococcus rotai]
MGKEKFQIMTKATEKENLIYSDSSCIVYCNVADFRDDIFWTVILWTENKKNTQQIKITNEQVLEVYKRINYLTVKELSKQVYVSRLGFIEEAPQSLDVPLLDWK